MPISAGLRDSIEHAESITYIEYGPDTDVESSQRKDSPAYRSDSYMSQMEDVTLVRDVFGGTKTMRAAKTDYLPKGPHEQDDEYTSRIMRATLYPAFERTVDGLVGMILRKDPIIEGPDAILEHADNIDMAGRDLPTFARDALVSSMVDGHTWVLVDYPNVDRAQVQSMADEREMGLRPYWVHLDKRQVHNWQYEMRNGRPVLTMLAYGSVRTEPDGEFGEKHREIVRVLRPGRWEEWEFVKSANRNAWVMVGEGTVSLDYIPAVPVYTNRIGIFESVPPLLQLAYENIRHWQVRSDRDYTLKFAGSPMPVFIGTNIKGVEWGAGRALFIEEPEAQALLLEAEGTSLNEQRMELKDIEARMASLGLQMLVRETRAAETAESKLLDKAESDSALATVARSLENALNEAWRMHMDFAGGGGEVVATVNRDFHEQQMDPSMIQAISGLVSKGQMSLDTMWDILRQGEMLPEDFDAEMEREMLEPAEPPPLVA